MMADAQMKMMMGGQLQGEQEVVEAEEEIPTPEE
jgi:hypothetical protein